MGNNKNNHSVDELSGPQGWRAVFYKLAWLTFSYPEDGLIDEVDSGVLFEGLSQAGSFYELGLEEDLRELQNQYERKTKREIRKELQPEFVRLFISELGGQPVPPYGSYYIDDRIFGDSTKEVIEFYRKTGFVKQQEHQGLPDHISVELEYLYKLAQTGEDGLLDTYINFYDRLLEPWYKKFTAKLVEETALSYFRVLGSWLEAGLKADRMAVAEYIGRQQTATATEGGYK